jgi:hypothetical protein
LIAWTSPIIIARLKLVLLLVHILRIIIRLWLEWIILILIIILWIPCHRTELVLRIISSLHVLSIHEHSILVILELHTAHVVRVEPSYALG